MFHMPMSSPMMTTMFGFLVCADAGAAASVRHSGSAANATAALSINRMNVLLDFDFGFDARQ